jgi:hypothetical protein
MAALTSKHRCAAEQSTLSVALAVVLVASVL